MNLPDDGPKVVGFVVGPITADGPGSELGQFDELVVGSNTAARCWVIAAPDHHIARMWHSRVWLQSADLTLRPLLSAQPGLSAASPQPGVLKSTLPGGPPFLKVLGGFSAGALILRR